MKQCNIAGCGKAATGYSTLCSHHRKTKARHGHPLQAALRRRELQPYEKAVRQWLDSRSGPDAWAILSDRWEAAVAKASVYCERVGHRRPFQRNLLHASTTIVRVDQEGNGRDAIVRLLALGYLHHADPRRFRSDEAFRFQVARQFRALTDVNVGVHWDHRTGKTKRVYRDTSPKTLRALWSLLSETSLLALGAQIGEADLKERTRRVHKEADAVRAVLGTTAYAAMAEGGSR